MAKSKRTNYYVSGKVDPLQTGDWVSLREEMDSPLRLEGIFLVCLSPKGRTIKLLNPRQTQTNGRDFEFYGSSTDTFGVGIKTLDCKKDYFYVSHTQLQRAIKDTQNSLDWYAERVEGKKTGIGDRPGRTDRVPFPPQD